MPQPSKPSLGGCHRFLLSPETGSSIPPRNHSFFLLFLLLISKERSGCTCHGEEEEALAMDAHHGLAPALAPLLSDAGTSPPGTGQMQVPGPPHSDWGAELGATHPSSLRQQLGVPKRLQIEHRGLGASHSRALGMAQRQRLLLVLVVGGEESRHKEVHIRYVPSLH